MRKIINLIPAFLLLLIFSLHKAEARGAASFDNETLRYVVTYKWGLIHKDSGDATLTLKRSGDNYKVRLVGTSRSWADKFYKVRDTLESTIRVRDLKPMHYIKRMHERDRHDIDEIKFSHNGTSTTGVASRIRGKKGQVKKTETTFTATGPVYDFLSLFYYLRKLDYSKLNKYKSYTATVFSGKQKETVKIKSEGIEKIKLRDKSEREAYHIKFNFTQHGGKKSSDDIDVWISTDSSHIPLYIVGNLKVGEIRVYLKS